MSYHIFELKIHKFINKHIYWCTISFDCVCVLFVCLITIFVLNKIQRTYEFNQYFPCDSMTEVSWALHFTQFIIKAKIHLEHTLFRIRC